MKINRTHAGRVGTRLLSAMLSLVMALSLLPGAIVPVSAASWMEPYLEKLVSWGVMRGDSTGNLHPDRTLTRGEFVVLVNRAFGYDDTSASVPFRDVKASDWYYDDINIGYTTGYFNGTSKNTASPKNSVTREQAAVLLGRNLALDDNPGASLDFTDSNSLSNYSRGLIRSSVVEGILSGYGDGSFRPKQSITRGQMAVLLVNAIGTPVNKSGTQTLGGVYGNVTISTSGVTLKDTTIAGNLYITGGLGLGDVTLENVNVLGKIVVCGAGESEKGENSVILRGVTAPTLIMDNLANNVVSVRAEGSTKIDNTSIRTPSYVEDATEDNYGFTSIKVEGEDGTTLSAAGNLKEIVTVSPKSTVTMAKGSVQSLTVDEAAAGSTVSVLSGAAVKTLNLDTGTTVTGKGDVDQMNVNTTGTKAEMLPDTITVRPGIDATIDGQKMDTTLAAESSADPRLLAGYPKITDLAPASAKGLMRTNKAGTLYWALTSVTDGSVGEADLLKPANNANIVKSGNMKAAASNTDYSAAVSSLTSDGSYYFSAMLVDARDQHSPVKTVSFSTPDNTTPNFATGYPYMSKITNNSGEVTVMPTKTCRLYYALLPKNATAPTDKDFKANAVSGNLGFGSRDVTKNVTDTFRVNQSALKELVSYDLYLWLTDVDGAHSSAVKKVSFTTIDGTPPKFVSGPTVNSIQETSVGMAATLDEAGTIYWVAVKEGEEYPKPMNGQTTKPELTSDAAKLQVANGMNALKSGNVSATANKDTAISITGLTSETAYDVYYVAQDKTGNYSATVGKMTIHTLDTNPPTITQEFTRTNDTAGASPLADTDINIIFSESVQDSEKNQKLLEVYEQSVASKDTADLAALLSRTIQLYTADVTPAVPVADRSSDSVDNWVIDYRKAIVTAKDGKIIVTFKTDSDKSKSALNLQSGSKYYFQIQNIADTSTSKNIIKPNPTKLDTFTTVYAQVNLTSAPSSGETGSEDVNFDMSFTVVPISTKNTSASVKYDILFRTASQVSFKLYTRDDGETNWSPVNDGAIASLNSSVDGTVRGISYSRSFLDKKPDGTVAFGQLNKLTKNREFGIKFTSLNGSTDSNIWNGKVEMEALVVAGSSYSDLNNLSQTDITGNELAQYLPPTGVLTQISTPTSYTMRCIFTDSTAPVFRESSPKFEPSDVSTVMNLYLSRNSGKIYYVVAPLNLIQPTLESGAVIDSTEKWEALPETTQTTGASKNWCYSANPSASEIMNPSYSDSRIKIGRQITYSGSNMPISLRDLMPNTEYCVFFVLQGDSQNVFTTNPYVFRFKTSEITRPVITLQNSSPSVLVSTDSTSDVDYVLVRNGAEGSFRATNMISCITDTGSDLYKDFTDTYANSATMTVLDAMSETAKGAKCSVFDKYADEIYKKNFAEQIRSLVPDGKDVMALGSVQVDADKWVTVNCDGNMQAGVTYTFFCVGKSIMVSDGSGDAFRAIRPIAKKDTEPPMIASCTFYPATPINPGDPCTGTLNISFTKPLYYVTGTSPDQTTVPIVNAKMDPSNSNYMSTTLAFSELSIGAVSIHGLADSAPSPLTPISAITFEITNAREGAYIKSGGEGLFCDKSGNPQTSKLTILLKYIPTGTGDGKVLPSFVITSSAWDATK